MAQHGYLGDNYGSEYDPNYDPDEERGRGWRGDAGRDRRFMLGAADDENRRERGGRFDSDADEWFGSRSAGRHRMSRYGPEHGFGGSQGDYGQGRRRLSAHPDDHYRSWRDRQIEALDRDYEDYCREREQQFHRDFDSWRENRKQRGSSAETMELTNPTGHRSSIPAADPAVGTNTPGTTTTGRRR